MHKPSTLSSTLASTSALAFALVAAAAGCVDEGPDDSGISPTPWEVPRPTPAGGTPDGAGADPEVTPGFETAPGSGGTGESEPGAGPDQDPGGSIETLHGFDLVEAFSNNGTRFRVKREPEPSSAKPVSATLWGAEAFELAVVASREVGPSVLLMAELVSAQPEVVCIDGLDFVFGGAGEPQVLGTRLYGSAGIVDGEVRSDCVAPGESLWSFTWLNGWAAREFTSVSIRPALAATARAAPDGARVEELAVERRSAGGEAELRLRGAATRSVAAGRAERANVIYLDEDDRPLAPGLLEPCASEPDGLALCSLRLPPAATAEIVVLAVPSADVVVAQGQPCSGGETCADGLECVDYWGIDGAKRASCEIPCKGTPECPDGQVCAVVSDGPGSVCI